MKKAAYSKAKLLHNLSPSGRAMTQAVTPRPLTAESRVRALVSIHVGFVEDKMALGQVFLRVLQFSSAIIIPPSFSIYIYTHTHTHIIRGMNNMSVSGSSSET
jgi:hypothetical protein